jgi:hypothetical protein
MPLKTLKFKPPEDADSYKLWAIHSVKSLVILVIIGIIAAALSIVINFAAYYTANIDNKQLTETTREMSLRANLALLDREANVAKYSALQHYLLTHDSYNKEDIKQTMSSIDATINAYEGEVRASDLSGSTLSDVRKGICDRLEAAKTPCS